MQQCEISDQGGFTAAHSLHKIKPCRNEILQIIWTDTSFHEMVPNFSRFTTTLELGMNHGVEGQTSTQRQGDFIRSILGWKFGAHNLSKDSKWEMCFQVCRGLIVQISLEYSDTWGLGYYQKKGPNKESCLILVMPMAKGIAQCKNQWIFVFFFPSDTQCVSWENMAWGISENRIPTRCVSISF